MNRLRRYARRPARREEAETCELCRAPVGEEHRHLVDLSKRTLACACRACALLFEKPGAARGRYRTIPERVLVDRRLSIDEESWTRLDIPVQLAFFFFHSTLDRWVAIYPSPAGAVESELSLEALRDIFGPSRLLSMIESDVEALLVDRSRECFLVPIDVCYRLVATVRSHWSGFDGGPQVREAIDTFFTRLSRKGVTA